MAACTICGSTEGVRHFALTVDGPLDVQPDLPLDVQPDLCQLHGDAFLVRSGALLGDMLREHQESQELGTFPSLPPHHNTD